MSPQPTAAVQERLLLPEEVAAILRLDGLTNPKRAVMDLARRDARFAACRARLGRRMLFHPGRLNQYLASL